MVCLYRQLPPHTIKAVCSEWFYFTKGQTVLWLNLDENIFVRFQSVASTLYNILATF